MDCIKHSYLPHLCEIAVGASLLSPLDWKPLELRVFSPSSQLSPPYPKLS